MDIAVILFEGFDDLDAIGPFEVFSHASRAGAALDVDLVTLESTDVITSSHGLQIVPDGILPMGPFGGSDGSAATSRNAGATPDLIVVPGGGWSDRAEVGTRAEVDRGTLPETLYRLHDAGATVASVCTGGMLLASAGLTDGRPAVTHHEALEDLAESGAAVVDSRVVDDGDILTAGGITAGIDLALHILEREFGREIATAVESTMEYERRERAYTR